MNDIVAIFASARSNGNTKKLMDRINNELDINIIDLSDKNISAYDYQHRNNNDDFISVMSEILTYKKIIFATPIYWYAASAQMKMFLDRTTDLLDLAELKSMGRKLRNKQGYVVCTSANVEADINFLSMFEKTFNYLGMHYEGHIHANCQDGYKHDNYEEDVELFLKMVNS